MARGKSIGVIRVLPYDQVAGRPPAVADGAGAGADPLSWAPTRLFTPSGRAALDATLRTLALDPHDDVLITNSSGQTYVSSCVTCTVFNHCRPTRVLTDRTRAIVVIHEYGYPHPELAALLESARNRGIPLIEDCAHSLDSISEGVPLGSLGDFAIFSLSKVLPVPGGGILVTDGRSGVAADVDDDTEAEAAYRTHLPALPEYSLRRRRNYDAVRARFPELDVQLEAGSGITPFFVGLITPRAAEIRARSSAIEWGSTLRDDLLLVPTNPFVDPAVLVEALDGAFGRQDPLG